MKQRSHDRIDASHGAGMLRLCTPVADQAKPRKLAVSGGDSYTYISS
ncbi:hypothetical protein [Streptomyces sp. MK37H]|nr:hypothetical protein [Streptomyces sp. MK37H]MBP8536060.1 hypothetical protein [Streptomyces sp. MK37H]